MFLLYCILLSFLSPSYCLSICLDYFTDFTHLQDHHFLVSRPPLPEEGPLLTDLVSDVSKALEAKENQARDDAEGLEDEMSLTMSPPPALSEDTCVDKKRKHVKELASSSTSIQRTAAGEAPVQEDDLELFDFMAS
jgi:hypothetical protein